MNARRSSDLHRSSQTEATRCWCQSPWWWSDTLCWNLWGKRRALRVKTQDSPSHVFHLAVCVCACESVRVTWVADFDHQVVHLLFLSLQRAQSLNRPSGSVDGEGQRCGGGNLGFDGVRELGIQCPFFISIMGHQLSHLVAWNQEYQSSQTKGVCQSLLRLNIIFQERPPSLLTLNPTVVITFFIKSLNALDPE